MKKNILLIMMILSAMLLASCQNNDRDVYQIVTTLFPQYDIAKAIVKDEMTVKNVLPFGTDPHSFEITSKDRQYIESSELFIYTSDSLENWVKDISLTQTLILNLELELELEHHDHVHEDHDEEHDVHFWTNPHTMEDMVSLILAHLIEIKPSLADLFTKNANAYIETLPRELTIRARNLLSRTTNTSDDDDLPSKVKFNGWTLDGDSRCLVSPAGNEFRLPRSEFRALHLFLSNPGKILTREQLIMEMTGRELRPNDRTVDVTIRRIRKHFESEPGEIELIVTIHGEGYRFCGSVDA